MTSELITGPGSQGLQCEPHGRDLLGVSHVILIHHVRAHLYNGSDKAGTITKPQYRQKEEAAF